MRPATGSQSLLQTGSVLVIHSERVQAAIVPMPDGSADLSSSQRSARRSASATSARSAARHRGIAERLRCLVGRQRRHVGEVGARFDRRHVGGGAGMPKPIGKAPVAVCVLVSEASAIWRARSQLTGPSIGRAGEHLLQLINELLHGRRVVGVRDAAGHLESEWDVGHASHRTRSVRRAPRRPDRYQRSRSTHPVRASATSSQRVAAHRLAP